MHASLFFIAFLATVMAQSSSSDDSPLTTITLDASDIIAPAPATASAVTITNTRAPVTTITISNTAAPVVTTSASAAGTQQTVLVTSTITSTLCGSCASSVTGKVTVAPVATTIKSSTVIYSTRNATASGVPYGGNDAFPVNKGTTLSNGTVIYTGSSTNLPGAGALAISAGVLAASYFALVL